jgi:beta-lactamase regulating signal transducer with metallopeptidase domain
MPLATLNAIAQSSAERLVNASVEGVLVAFVVWLALRLLPRQNAGTRFSLWMAALLSIATLPLAEAVARVDRPIGSAVSHHTLTVSAGWGTALFVAWAAVAMLLLARVLVGVVQLWRLRNSAEKIDLATLDSLPRQTLLDFQQYRQASLCVSDDVSVPTAVGLFRPAVVVPRWILAELSAADLNSVLVHELAHLRRYDDWTNLLQKLVRALFFFHPAVWWIEGRLSLEREMACDEHVLATVDNPRAYAACLVSLAERGFLHRAIILAQGAVHRVKECSARVAQILAHGRPRSARSSRFALAGAASGSVLLLATFAQAPNLIEFSSKVAPPVAASKPAHNHTSSDAMLVPAAWHPKPESTPRVIPANYTVAPTAPKAAPKQAVKKLSKSPANAPAIRRETMQRNSPPVYRTALTAPQTMPGTFVIVKQTDFYSDGTQVWAVSIYRVAVLKPSPTTPNDISQSAI